MQRRSWNRHEQRSARIHGFACTRHSLVIGAMKNECRQMRFLRRYIGASKPPITANNKLLHPLNLCVELGRR